MFIINTQLVKKLLKGEIAARYKPTGSNIDMLTCLLRTAFPNDTSFIDTVFIEEYPYYTASQHVGIWARLKSTNLSVCNVEDFFDEIEEEKIVITEEVLKVKGFEQAGEGLDLLTLKVNNFLHIGYSLRTKKLCVLKTSNSALPIKEGDGFTEETIIHEIVIVREGVEDFNVISKLYESITDKKL